MVELGDVDGPGIVGEYALIGRSDDGDYFVSYSQEGRLVRFSSDGVFRAAIGRIGEGPGEYRFPVLMRGNADTLLILDAMGARITTIRGDAIETSMLPMRPGEFALLPDGHHVYNSPSYDADQIGHPLQLYDEESGRITRSFGGEGIRVDGSSESQTAMRRVVAPAADGNVWAGHNNRYRIDKWSPDGDRITRIERDAPWFLPWAEWPGMVNEVEPVPVIVGVRDWGDDLLMVVLKVADDEWRPMPPARYWSNHEVISSAQLEDLHDTVIEVLDTRSGTVLARTRIDANVRGLVGGDAFSFYSYAEHSDMGEAKFVVWSVALSGIAKRRQ